MKRDVWVGISPSVITHIHVMSAVQWDDVRLEISKGEQTGPPNLTLLFTAR